MGIRGLIFLLLIIPIGFASLETGPLDAGTYVDNQGSIYKIIKNNSEYTLEYSHTKPQKRTFATASKQTRIYTITIAQDEIYDIMQQRSYAQLDDAQFEAQQKLENFVKKNKGIILKEYKNLGIYRVKIPQTTANELQDQPFIDTATPFNYEFTKHLDISSQSVGQPFAQQQNLTGRFGEQTANVSIAIIDTGVNHTHPFLINNSFSEARLIDERDFSNEGTLQDLDGHGTHVASIAISSNETYTGTAPGATRLVNAKFLAVSNSNNGDPIEAMEWTLNGSITPVNISSNSWGCSSVSFPSSCDPDGNTTTETRYVDAATEFYNMLFVFSAGNDGPSGSTIGIPADAYNVLSVANVNDQNTVSRSDDIVWTTSSRGPTADGRKKPDISAPGTGIVAANNLYATASDTTSKTGTSMAAPLVSGSALLFSQLGLTNLQIKALLLNTADDKGSIGWDSSYGWGLLNISTAYNHRLNVTTINITENQTLWYLLNATTAKKATITWLRHVSFGGYTTVAGISPLNDIDLYAYVFTNNTLINYSTSGIDNVEQIVTSVSDPVVLVIDAFTQDFQHGVDYELVGFAANGNVSVMQNHNLSLNSFVSYINNNSTAIMTCEVTNTGGLPAHNVTVTFTAHSSLASVNGTNTSIISMLNASLSQNVSLQYTGTNGTYVNNECAAASNSFGKTVTTTDSPFTIFIGNATPTVTSSNPSKSLVQTNTNVTLFLNITNAFLNYTVTADGFELSCSGNSTLTQCNGSMLATTSTVTVNLNFSNILIAQQNLSVFTIDDTAPNMHSITSSASEIQTGTNVSFTINATDTNDIQWISVNGLNATNNGSHWVVSIIVSQENITVLARDNATNTQINITLFTLDNTAPITRANLTVDSVVINPNVWHNQSILVNLSVIEANTVNLTEYRFGKNGSWQIYSAPFNITQNLPSNLLYFRSKDIAGNQELRNVTTVRFDNKSPQIISVTFPQGIVRPTQNVSLRVIVTDSTSGIQNVSASTNNQTINFVSSGSIYDAAFATPSVLSTYEINITVFDNANNSVQTTSTYAVSQNAPSVSASILNNTAVPINQTIEFTLDNVTNGYYNVTLNSSQTFFSANTSINLTFTNAGSESIIFFINNSNTSTFSTFTYNVDNVAPTINLTSLNNNANVSGRILITVDIADNNSIKNVTLQTNDTFVASDTAAPYFFLLSTFSLTEGSHVIQINATDIVNNTATIMLNVTVQNNISVQSNVSGGIANFDNTIIDEFIPLITGLNASTINVQVQNLVTTGTELINLTAINQELLLFEINASTDNVSTIYIGIPKDVITLDPSDVQIYADHGSGFTGPFDVTLFLNNSDEFVFLYNTTEYSDFVLTTNYDVCGQGQITQTCLCANIVRSSGNCCSGEFSVGSCVVSTSSGGGGGGGGGSSSVVRSNTTSDTVNPPRKQQITQEKREDEPVEEQTPIIEPEIVNEIEEQNQPFNRIFAISILSIILVVLIAVEAYIRHKSPLLERKKKHTRKAHTKKSKKS